MMLLSRKFTKISYTHIIWSHFTPPYNETMMLLSSNVLKTCQHPHLRLQSKARSAVTKTSGYKLQKSRQSVALRHCICYSRTWGEDLRCMYTLNVQKKCQNKRLHYTETRGGFENGIVTYKSKNMHLEGIITKCLLLARTYTHSLIQWFTHKHALLHTTASCVTSVACSFISEFVRRPAYVNL